jgi:hypothetical protein
MRLWAMVAALVAMVGAGPAAAGETAEFDAALADAWGHYRAALTQAGRDGGGAKGQLAAFLDSWQRLQGRWATTPPPQFAEEAEWKETLNAVADIAGRALAEFDRKAPDDAQETLSEIKAVLADLRRRNNVTAFADVMNDFAETLDEAIAAETPSAKSQRARRDQLAVLRWLADRIQKNAPRAVQETPDFAKMSENLVANIERARTLAEGKPDMLDRALAAIRASYEKLFLKFG